MNYQDNVMINLPHHQRHELCTRRPAYRQGKKLTAVKVYTVNNESAHLLVYKVPALNLTDELMALCSRFGPVDVCDRLMTEEEVESFTHVYHVHYKKIHQARYAKRQLDDRSFFGSLLHVCYAPELETFEETKSKLVNRRLEIAVRTGRRNSFPKLSSKFGASKRLKTIPSTSHDTPPVQVSQPQFPVSAYPSQVPLVLPGKATPVPPKFVPSPVVKKGIGNANRIVFHSKTNETKHMDNQIK